MAASGKRFTIDKQSDPVEFLSWLANTLHHDLTGGKRKRRSGARGAAPWGGARAAPALAGGEGGQLSAGRVQPHGARWHGATARCNRTAQPPCLPLITAPRSLRPSRPGSHHRLPAG